MLDFTAAQSNLLIRIFVLNTLPLVVDLDGTLVNTDMLHESAIKIFATQPHKLFTLPYWLARGKAKLKQYFAKHSELDITSLPYNLNLLHWLKEQHQAGRKLILCTASDTKIANAIANHLGIFSEVLASDGKTNLSGKQKAQLLIERFGQNKFDYVGNSRTDLIVWQNACKAIIVNASKKIISQAHHYGNVEKIFHSPALNLSIWRRVLRVHQWL
jgi:phosphoserine phosphatase